MSHTTELHYQVTPIDPYAHVFQVTLDIPFPLSAGQLLRMPAWIPGSYMIRDFAKNILWLKGNYLEGDTETAALELTKVDKQTWCLPETTGPVRLTYQVYAWDMSVRAAHLDQTHAYFNGTSVFLELVGHSHLPCRLDIRNADIAEARNWRVGTALPSAGAATYGFGAYRAADYGELIDHPVEIADFDLVSFEACGIPHDFVLTGRHHADLPRLAEDLKVICEYQIRLFGEPAPFERYVFITWAVGDGYGGLEHRASTSLICKREDLPAPSQRGQVSEGYQTFLGLCSHEYFHSWNVKRIRPDIPYDLSVENHTPLLWAFEGITSYYDDLTLVRTGLISQEDYLVTLGKSITRLLRNPGRRLQSTAESSFDAWTRFYKQDENAPNAIVSYYTKGSLIALGLDLTLRRLTDHAVTLDQVMRALWHQHGQTGTPVAEDSIQQLCRAHLQQADCAASIAELDRFLQQAIYGTGDLAFAQLLEPVGVGYHLRPATSPTDSGGRAANGNASRVDLGIATGADSGGARVQRVLNDSPGHRAGLSAGDLLIALDGIKLEQSNLETLLSRYQPGDRVRLHAFRRDELMRFQVTLAPAPADTAYLSIDNPNLARRWLSGK